MLPATIATTAACSFVAGFSHSLCGLGGSVLFTIGWSLSSEFGLVPRGIAGGIPFIMIHIAVVCPTIAWHLRELVPWRFCILVATVWNVVYFVGSALLRVVDGSTFKRGIGCVLFLIFTTQAAASILRFQTVKEVLQSVFFRRKVTLRAEPGEEDGEKADLELQHLKCGEAPLQTWESPFENIDGEAPPSDVKVPSAEAAPADIFDLSNMRNVVAAVSLGSCAGFLQGLCGIAFPATLVYTLLTGVEKDAWRATNSAIFALTVVPGAWYFFLFQSGYHEAQLPLYATAFLANVLAVPAGSIASTLIDQQRFRELLLLNMLGGSVLLMCTEMDLPVLMAICSVTALAGIVRHAFW
jgi:uncharacterized membrane protein YfcA